MHAGAVAAGIGNSTAYLTGMGGISAGPQGNKRHIIHVAGEVMRMRRKRGAGWRSASIDGRQSFS